MLPPRKIATSVALGAGAATTGYWSVLLGQAVLARHVIGVTDARPPSPDGTYGDDLPGTPIRCLVLGDSATVGYGMVRADATPSAQIGLGLAQILDTPIDVRCVAVVGAQTADLREQIDTGIDHDPDLAVIVVGVNDVTHRVPAYASARLLGASVRRLTDAGAQVVVGTCPDLGTVKPLPQPLRWVARRKSRALARRQTVAVVRAGGRAVSLGSLLAPMFTEKSDLMFGDDRFHPSEAGYATMVSVLVPSLAAAWRERHRDFAVSHADAADVVSLTEAAARAARSEGTEVQRQGRWARTLRRRRA